MHWISSVREKWVPLVVDYVTFCQDDVRIFTWSRSCKVSGTTGYNQVQLGKFCHWFGKSTVLEQSEAFDYYSLHHLRSWRRWFFASSSTKPGNLFLDDTKQRAKHIKDPKERLLIYCDIHNLQIWKVRWLILCLVELVDLLKQISLTFWVEAKESLNLVVLICLMNKWNGSNVFITCDNKYLFLFYFLKGCLK